MSCRLLSLFALFVGICQANLVQGGMVGLQVFGDSLSDEYSSQTYSYADNWVEQIVEHRGVHVGGFASWGEPRRTGYELNWARYGARSSDLVLAIGVLGSQVADQIAQGKASHSVLAIGANDFFPSFGGAYYSIYHGNWSDSQISSYVDTVVGNVEEIASSLKSFGSKIVLGTVPDYGHAPSTWSSFPDAQRRERVGGVLEQVNERLDSLAQTHGLVLVDIAGIANDVFGPHTSPNATVTVGGVPIHLLSAGTASTNAFVGDGIHPHTVVQGILANLMLEGLNRGYRTGVPLFEEEEILSHAGLVYGGLDTFGLEYSDYVRNYVPELSGIALLGIPVSCVVIWRAGRRFVGVW